jgi:calcium permeable stress-gated cation channel
MDAYFFVRFLRLMCKVFIPIWLISWVVLMPVTSVNTSVPGHSGLDIFVFGNVAKSQTDRYAAHIILVWLFTSKLLVFANNMLLILVKVWIWYNIKIEMAHFITTRQQHLIAPAHALSVQAKTILVTGIPAKYLNEAALLKLYNHLPGGVQKIWLNRCANLLHNCTFATQNITNQTTSQGPEGAACRV